MSYECETKHFPAQHALCIRARTAVQDLPVAVGEAFGRIMAYLCDLGEKPAGPPFVAYHNQDMQDLDAEIGFPVATILPGLADIRATEIPASSAGTCVHTGPFSAIERAYTALMAWMQSGGYDLTGVAYEIYLNDPDGTPPDKLQTRILFPLK
jgi:effector-binding domain-containing protein